MRALRVALLVLLAALAAAAPAAAGAGPTRSRAERYARRTYIVQSGRHRHFTLVGPRRTVTARDGSTISAFGAVLADAADGTGQVALLFHGSRFAGWASAYDTVRLRVGSRGRAIRVLYGVYRDHDAFCCPSARKPVEYRWNGRRITASARPPLVYGRRGDRLHLG